MIDWENINPKDEFKGKVLRGIDFSGRILIGVDFSDSTLQECNFDRCDLSYANFHNTDLYKSTFRDSVLYCAQYKNSNLTRADFTGARIYGIHVSEFSNITYCKFEAFKLEIKRRSATVIGQHTPTCVSYSVGSQITSIDSLSNFNYAVNGYEFRFEEFDKAEMNMQRSQIYNRLKRLYSANAFREEARNCHYWERYYLTRSWYKHHIFTGERIESGDFKNVARRLIATVASYTHEQMAGYGLKPSIVLRNFFVVFGFYYLVVSFVIKIIPESGILFGAVAANGDDITVVPLLSYKVLTASEHFEIGYFSFFSLFGLNFQNFVPYGHMVWVASVASICGLLLLALLISTLFSRLRLD